MESKEETMTNQMKQAEADEWNSLNGESIRDKKRRKERGHNQIYSAVQLSEAYKREMGDDSIYETLLRNIDNQGVISLVEYAIGEEYWVTVWGPFKSDG